MNKDLELNGVDPIFWLIGLGLLNIELPIALLGFKDEFIEGGSDTGLELFLGL